MTRGIPVQLVTTLLLVFFLISSSSVFASAASSTSNIRRAQFHENEAVIVKYPDEDADYEEDLRNPEGTIDPSPVHSTASSTGSDRAAETRSWRSWFGLRFTFGFCSGSASSVESVVDQSAQPQQPRTSSLKRQLCALKAVIDDKNIETKIDLLNALLSSINDVGVLYGSEKPLTLGRRSVLMYAVAKDRFLAFIAILRYAMMTAPDEETRVSILNDILVYSVKCGRLEFVRFLIEEMHTPVLQKQKLFHWAVARQVPKNLLYYIFRLCPSSWFNIRFNSITGDSVYHLAVRYHNFDAFMLLWQNGLFIKNIMLSNLQMDAPISLLLRASRIKFLESILNAVPEFLYTAFDERRHVLIHLAACLNQLSALKFILERDIELLNYPNADLQTPLVIAIRNDAADVASYLLKFEANFTMCDKYGFNALRYSAQSKGAGSELLVPLLLRYKTHQKHLFSRVLESTMARLMRHARWQQLDVVFEAFFNEIGSLDVPLVVNDPVELATILFNLDCPFLFEYFLRRGIFDVNSRIVKGDGEYCYMLHLAAKSRNSWFVQRLLEGGAKADVVDSNRKTPFGIALNTGNRAVMKAFIAFGGVVVDDTCKEIKFKAFLMNGATFVPGRRNQLIVPNAVVVMHLFMKLFSSARSDPNPSAEELAIICMQMDLFLAHFWKPEHEQNGFAIHKLDVIVAYRLELAERFAQDRPELADMLRLFSPAVQGKLFGFVPRMITESFTPSSSLVPSTDPDGVFGQLFSDYLALFEASEGAL